MSKGQRVALGSIEEGRTVDRVEHKVGAVVVRHADGKFDCVRVTMVSVDPIRDSRGRKSAPCAVCGLFEPVAGSEMQLGGKRIRRSRPNLKLSVAWSSTIIASSEPGMR